MFDWKKMKNTIFFLIILVFCTGCTQENTVSGVYLNEAHNAQYITFGDGSFSQTNYNNTPAIATGTFKVNNTVLTLYYNDGETVEYFISDNGAELIPVTENSSLPETIKMVNRFAKRMLQ